MGYRYVHKIIERTIPIFTKKITAAPIVGAAVACWVSGGTQDPALQHADSDSP